MMPATLSIRSLSAIAALVLGAFAAPARAMTVTSGSYLNSGIGAEFATSYDNFSILGATDTFATPTSPIDVTIATYSFEIGPNCWSCSLTPSFDAIFDITIDGVTKQLDLPYAWHSSGLNDFLTFGTAAPVQFDFGNMGRFMLALDSIDMIYGAGGSINGNVNATLTPIPEPATYAMMFAGLGALGFVARGRRR